MSAGHAASDQYAHHDADAPAPVDGEEVAFGLTRSVRLGHARIAEKLRHFQIFIVRIYLIQFECFNELRMLRKLYFECL